MLTCAGCVVLQAEFFDKLDFIGRAVRGGRVGPSQLPFGGLQLVLAGDFLQLPPVIKGARPDPATSPIYAFQSRAWRAAVPNQVLLRAVHRQKEQSFVRLLSEVIMCFVVVVVVVVCVFAAQHPSVFVVETRNL